MADIEVTFCVLRSVLIQPILDGEVKPKGLKLDIREGKSMDALSRSMLNLEFDIAEMSIATYSKAREQGMPLIALPLFTSGRRFMHAGLQFAARAGIRDPSELRGRTVAVGQYWLSAAIWQRQFLQEMYGVAPDEMNWVTLRPERLEALRIPPGVKHRLDSSGRSPRELAAAGEIDATLSPGGHLPPDTPDPLIPAFPNLLAAQRAYYDRTGVFPIVHITVIKQDLVNRHPEIVGNLCDAYLRAREIARARPAPASTDSPAGGEVTKELLEIIGSDPWTYGVRSNRKPLEAFVATAYAQQLVSRKLTVDELFVPNLPEPLQ
jgi:4,5-dihydroxyphthalate decarboxylase